MGYSNCPKKQATATTAAPVVVAVVVVMVVMLSAIEPVLGQTNLPCVLELVPCAEYLNSTSPPASCCTPLKNVFANEVPCICAVLNDPSLLKSLGINITTALALVHHCNITAPSPTLCSSAPTAAPRPPTPTPVVIPSEYLARWAPARQSSCHKTRSLKVADNTRKCYPVQREERVIRVTARERDTALDSNKDHVLPRSFSS